MGLIVFALTHNTDTGETVFVGNCTGQIASKALHAFLMKKSVEQQVEKTLAEREKTDADKPERKEP